MIRDEAAIRERAAKGAQYREHLPDIRAAVDVIAEQYAAELLNCHDPEGRERLWQAYRVCQKVKEHFGALVSGGTLAQHQLQELSKAR